MDTFLQHWNSNELLTFDRLTLERLNISVQQTNFLTETGLPKEAAPFLSFENDLKSLNEIYELEEPDFQTKIEIGSDGSGDPICLDLTNQQIYAFDHEEDFKPRFMNTSVVELFKFLSLFKEFGEQLISEKGEDAFIDCDFSDEELFELTTKMRLLDSTAFEPSTFWQGEIESMKANREYYRSENTGDNIR